MTKKFSAPMLAKSLFNRLKLPIQGAAGWKSVDAVHLWSIFLTQESSFVQSLFDSLSPDEQARAGKYRFKKDREPFIVMRGAVRQILGSYLNIEPNRVCFSYNQYGKPALSKEINKDSFCFNASRSRDFALCAVSCRREIGVDIEFTGEGSADLKIAAHFFSESEKAHLESLPKKQQTNAFFRCWTRKEAYIKAIGEGLSHPLQDFSVPVGVKGRSDQISITDEFQTRRQWSLTTVAPSPDYIAALAVEGSPPIVKFRQWTKTFLSK